MSWLQKVRQKTIESFLDRMVAMGEAPLLIENPTEELVDAHARGKNITVYGKSPSPAQVAARLALNDMARKSGDIRFEENYFFSTRRYPKAVDNVLPAGDHIPAGDFLYFNAPVGSPGSSQGFPTGFDMSETETNADTQNSTPQGKGFKVWQEGISFNTEALHGDIEQILDSGAFRYQTQGSTYALRKGALRMWPGGQGVVMASAQQGAESAHNGIADPRAARSLKFARLIKPLQQFNYVHSVPRAERATTGEKWKLTAFTLCTVWLWGHQLDAIPG